MTIRNWSESFETGVEEIDQEHRELLAILEEIENHATQDPDRCGSILRKFTKKASEHFHHEESVLRNAGFSRVDQHRNKHRAIMTELRRIARLYRKSGHMDRDALIAALKHITFRDVIEADMDFKSYMTEIRERSKKNS